MMHFVVVVPCCIQVYPIGIPALYGVLLWRHRARLIATADDAAARNTDVTLRSTHFLTAPYKVNVVWANMLSIGAVRTLYEAHV
jgi:hypothetical protein